MKLDIKHQAGKAINKASSGAKATAHVLAKAAGGAKNTAQTLAEKAKDENTRLLLKKYNPVFPDEYFSAAFCIPNLLIIVDDAVRRDIDVCRGAIGWRSVENGVEVFHIYDEFIHDSGLHFLPSAMCDNVYYVNPLDRECFISLDGLYNTMQASKLAELSDVAFSLGTRRYNIELSEQSKSYHSAKGKATAKASAVGKNAAAEEQHEIQNETRNHNVSLASAEFSESHAPQVPTLRWFAHNDVILNLIHQVCSGEGRSQSYDIELLGSSYATMTQNTAAKIDGALNSMKVSSSVKLEEQAINEYSHKMIFHIEF